MARASEKGLEKSHLLSGLSPGGLSPGGWLSSRLDGCQPTARWGLRSGLLPRCPITARNDRCALGRVGG
jgi:hypothetical protein